MSHCGCHVKTLNHHATILLEIEMLRAMYLALHALLLQRTHSLSWLLFRHLSLQISVFERHDVLEILLAPKSSLAAFSHIDVITEDHVEISGEQGGKRTPSARPSGPRRFTVPHDKPACVTCQI